MFSILFCLLSQSKIYPTPQARVELVPSTIGMSAGQTVQVAVHLEMPPAWHSFFINPGETGKPIKVQWKLPPGFKAGAIQWPAPSRKVVGRLASYVYEKEVWLVSNITTSPQAWDSRTLLSIKATVSWQLCRDHCFDQHATVELPAVYSLNPYNNLSFYKARRTLPIPLEGVVVHAQSGVNAVLLELPLARIEVNQIEFFPGDSGNFGAAPSRVRTKGAGIEVEIPFSSRVQTVPKRLKGLLVISSPLGNKKRSHWIDLPVTKS